MEDRVAGVRRKRIEGETTIATALVQNHEVYDAFLARGWVEKHVRRVD